MKPLRRAGEQRLESWLDRYYPDAYRTAVLVLHDRHDAEEAVQEAFLRAWRFRGTLPEGDAIRPWLYRVVVNACLSKLRSERTRKERTVAFDGDVGLASQTPGDPEWTAVLAEDRRAVLRAVGALPEHLRVVVVLRYFAQLSEKEIAGIVRRRPGTVKSRLHEARLRLERDPRLGELAGMEVEATIEGEQQ